MSTGCVTPHWSVVVPLYNKQDFIEATLRSVLNQDGHQALEVLVVDDGSSDEGAARVVAIDDPRVRLIRQANAGVSAARNHGIREARGQWVAFLDADDLWHPQALTALRLLAADYPQAQVLTGAYARVPSPEVERYRFAEHVMPALHRKIDNLPSELLERGMPFFTSSIAIRHDQLNQLNSWFPEGESMGEDLDLWLRLCERSAVAHTSSVIALYRTELTSSLMGQYKDLTLLPVWQRLRQRAQTAALPEPVRRSSLKAAAEMEVTLARRCAKAGERNLAWKHLAAARDAIGGHRWWVTLLALASGSSRLVARLR